MAAIWTVDAKQPGANVGVAMLASFICPLLFAYVVPCEPWRFGLTSGLGSLGSTLYVVLGPLGADVVSDTVATVGLTAAQAKWELTILYTLAAVAIGLFASALGLGFRAKFH